MTLFPLVSLKKIGSPLELNNNVILKLEKQIMKKVSVGISDEEEIYEEPKVIKKKKIKKNKKN